jgi:DNA-binding CsgD family transcriptional regulator
MTPRERQILTLFAGGNHPRYEDVARELGISAHTVKSHAYNLYMRLGARGKVNAVAVALRQGDIT